MSASEVVLCSPVRTAIGAFNGSLKAIPATELGATVVRETLRRAKLDPAAVGSVVMGNVIQAGNKMNPARQAAIGGGLPVSVPAHDRQPRLRLGCPGDRHGRTADLTGEIDAAVAGGMENMDRAPYLMDGGRWGYRMGPAEIHDSMLRDGLNDAFSGRHSGWHTEDLVTRRSSAARHRTALPPLATALRRGAKGGQVRRTKLSPWRSRQEGPERLRSTKRHGPRRQSKGWRNFSPPFVKAERSRPAMRRA